jgi:hypothetical protein
VADIIPPGVDFAPLLGQHSNFSISFLVLLSLLHKLHSQGIVFGLQLLAGSPEKENIFEGVKAMQGIHQVVQCRIIMRFIFSIHREF